MSDYLNKYLKYKFKYLKLKHNVSNNKNIKLKPIIEQSEESEESEENIFHFKGGDGKKHVKKSKPAQLEDGEEILDDIYPGGEEEGEEVEEEEEEEEELTQGGGNEEFDDEYEDGEEVEEEEEDGKEVEVEDGEEEEDPNASGGYYSPLYDFKNPFENDIGDEDENNY